jgi:hypothetical protein
VDIPTYPSDPSLTVRFTTATGDDLDDTLERAFHRALTEFCEHHLQCLIDAVVPLLPIRDVRNLRPHTSDLPHGVAFTARYALHVSSLLQEVTTVGAH